jgi:L-malate glycosyltransferase
MKTALKKITVLIPCYNEERGIEEVIKKFKPQALRQQGFKLEIVVIDNNSTDRTSEVAKSLGVKVIHELKKGKGNAIRAGFNYIKKDTDYVVMLDGDNTYSSEEIFRLVEPIDSGFCSVIIGSRLGGRITEGSMTFLNRAGNWFFSHLVRYIYRVNVTDVLTGYFAWKREAVERMRSHLVSDGFAIEMEMITKMARLGEEIYSVPISYNSRAGESNLRPFHDGMRILIMLLRNLSWWPRPQRIKRIAFVTDAIMPYNKGGKEKRLYEISKRLLSDACEVHIYTMKWWDGPKTIMREGVHLHALSKLYPLYKNDRRSMRQAIMFGLATLKIMFVKFDVLDVDHMPFFPLFSARIVTWLRGKKMHATWHEVWGREYWLEYLKGPVGFFGYLIERLAFLTPDVIVSNSVSTTSRLRQVGFKKEIKTIPLGVDLQGIFTANSEVEASDILFVGRLLSHKNADLLIKAIAIVQKIKPKIICKIIGDGPEKIKLEQLIKKLRLKDNIQILDSIEDNSDLYSAMKASKMLVLPSIREGFGLVVIEANAAGLPVITTSHQNNAAKDLIREGENGLLAEPEPDSLAKAILYILKNRETMQPKQGIEKYDWHFVAQQVRITLL